MLRKVLLPIIALCVLSFVTLFILAQNEDIVDRAERTIEAAEGPKGEYYTKVTDWTAREYSDINLSTYAFLDFDQDGAYSLGDRSLSDIAVELYYEGKFIATSRSNTNGFSNFSSQLRGAGARINKEGSYTFRAKPPEGWTVTTGNSEQILDYARLDGSIGGGALNAMPKPIGFAPQKYITGRATPNTEVTATDTDGTSFSGTADATGQFKLIVPKSGLYRVTAGARSVPIVVDVFPVHIGNIETHETFTDNLTLLDFEGQTATQTFKVPNGYGDLNWFNLNVIDAMEIGSGYVNAVTSGNHVIYLSSGHPAEITAPTAIDFQSVHITVAWRNAEGETLRVEMWRGDEKIVDDIVELSMLAPVLYAPNVRDITRIALTTTHHWQAVFDDLRIRAPLPSQP